MQWFDQNPAPGGNAFTKFTGQLRWEAHTWARSTHTKHFSPASSMARGGFASTAFAATPGEAFKSAFRPKAREFSTKHIANLERMAARSPNAPGIQNALADARKKAASRTTGPLGKKALAGGVLGAAMVVAPMFTTPGGVSEKGRAVVEGIGSLVGWEIGATVGAGIGGAIGVGMGGGLAGVLATGIGIAAGAFGGALVAGAAVTGGIQVADKMVERERKRRKLDWTGDKRAFQTQRASTMRQQSLSAMNRGMTTSRSAMGREGVMLHQ